METGSFLAGGMWIIFPIIGIPVMLVFMYFMFVRGGFRPMGPADRGDHGSGPDFPDTLEVRLAFL
ncbi:MAG: hypothetical protein CL878_03445 [Dehalococcoidia bacterium]|nr:hypothetical protein [Dehalococcoidia bacterium]